MKTMIRSSSPVGVVVGVVGEVVVGPIIVPAVNIQSERSEEK